MIVTYLPEAHWEENLVTRGARGKENAGPYYGWFWHPALA